MRWIILLLLLSSCSVRTTEYYAKHGYSTKVITGEIKWECKNAIWIDTIKICNYKGKQRIGDTVSITYISLTKYNQNEFICTNQEQ